MLTIKLPVLHPGQERVREALRRFNIVRMGRRWGKTTFALDYATDVDRGVLAGLPVGWFAPSYKTLQDAWREAKRSLKPLIRHKDEVEHRLELATGGVLEFWTLDVEDPARGRKYARVVVDEAGIVRRLMEKWDESIRPTLTDYAGDALFASTPKGRNDFWKLDQRGRARPGIWASHHAPSVENPYLPRTEIDEARKDLPAIVFRQEYEAQYVDLGGALIKPEWLRSGTPEYDWPVVLGVDLAISTKTTADYTAIVAISRAPTGHIYVRGALRFRDSFHRILEQIVAAAQRYKPTAIIIEDNQFQAAVVQELLRTTRLPVRGVRRDRDKLTAFASLAARYEQGLILHGPALPPEFQDEVLAFTGHDDDHDDFVDAFATAFLGLRPIGVSSVASAGTMMILPEGMPGTAHARR